MYKLSDLRDRDVINISDGRRLGRVADLEVDPDSGRVLALICPGIRSFLGFFAGPEQVIPWERVVRIGPDVILVDIPASEARGEIPPRTESFR